ncbi:axin-1-like [Argonauta hians]
MNKRSLQAVSETHEKFHENLPRPPVPGEENANYRQQSCCPQTSNPCCNAPCTSTACISTSASQANRAATCTESAPQSLALLYGAAHHVQRLNEGARCSSSISTADCPQTKEMDAPEGSTVNTPPYAETDTTTPPYLKWAENFDNLLDDSDGVNLLQTFLTQETGAATMLEFWFACQGLKNPARSAGEIPHLIKVIHKKFLRGDSIPFISSETRKELTERLKKSSMLDQSVFDGAQEEVLNYLRNNTYPLFLKSDLYVQYVQQGGKSPKASSNSSSGSNSVRPISVPLPTLPEDQELNTNTVLQSHSVIPVPLMKPATNNYRYSRLDSTTWRTETISGYGNYGDRNLHSSYPQHISYAPVSAQDSELHSLSSEATNDDTISMTDSSLDGIPIHTKPYQKRRTVRKRAEQNRESKDAPINQQFIPRTERAPKDRNIAEVDTGKFASMLIERLEKVHLEQERDEKLRESIRCISESNESEESKNVANAAVSSKLPPLIPIVPIDDELADSILEEHCSRIWESSAQQTPFRSPGGHSPKPKSPERAHRKALVPGMASIPVPALASKVHALYKKKEKDLNSMWSYDSGVGEDKSVGGGGGHHSQETTIYHHHHHHHHSSREGKSRQQIEHEAQKHSMLCYMGEAVTRNHPDYHLAHKDSERGRSHVRKSSVRKHSDASSNIDSGISTIYEKDTLPSVLNLSAPTTDKVLQWIMASDRYASGSSHTESDKSSSHKRSHTHKTPVATGGSPQLQKQGFSKKPSSSVLNRSVSAERGGMTSLPWFSGPNIGGSQVMPSQPIVQDPSMPLLTPPNPTTQLEEAKRRLETNEPKRRPEDSQARPIPVKSKSFIGVPSRDKRTPSSLMASGSYQMRTLPTTKTVPYELDLSGDNLAGHSESRKSKRPSGSATVPGTPWGPEETVIGYFFCGEPIPYRHTVSGKEITLAQFKELITKRGSYRYFFKKASSEFESLGVVFDEIVEDSALLPLWEGKIVAKVEKKE